MFLSLLTTISSLVQHLSPAASRRPESPSSGCALASVTEESEAEAVHAAPLPAGVVDYDKECEMDPFAVALYASDIFQYYKLREVGLLSSSV